MSSYRRFALVRAIRLMPLVVVGTLIAAVIELGRPGIVDQHAHLADIARATLSGALLIPTLTLTTLEYSVFPLNGPFWSLSLEAAANAVFAICARSRAAPIIVAAALALCGACMIWNIFFLEMRGFGAVPNSYWSGYARIGWSFSAGIFLYRFREYAPRVPLAAPTFALILIMLAPPSRGIIGQSFDLFSVLFGLPMIVWTAASARLGSKGQQWSTWSGDLSYPIYALHYPLIRVIGVVTLKYGPSLVGRIGIAAISLTIIVMSAWVVYAAIDAPIRRWLTVKFLWPAPSNAVFGLPQRSDQRRAERLLRR